MKKILELAMGAEAPFYPVFVGDNTEPENLTLHSLEQIDDYLSLSLEEGSEAYGFSVRERDDNASIVLSNGDEFVSVYLVDPTFDASVVDGFDLEMPLPVKGWEVLRAEPVYFDSYEKAVDAWREYANSDLSGNVSGDDDGDEPDDVVRINDCEIIGEITDEHNEFLSRPVKLTFGSFYKQHDKRNTIPGKWKTVETTWAAIISGLLSEHKESNEKAGDCIVLGSTTDGQRKAVAMDTMYGIGLDIDCGVDIDTVIQRLVEENIMALVYTSYNNGTTRKMESRDIVIKKMKLDREPTEDDMRVYLSTYKNERYLPEFLESLRVVDTKMKTGDGVKIAMEHDPLAKFRLFFPLETPVELSTLDITQAKALDKFADKITGLAVNVLKIPFDTACTDPSRLFYTPRHKPGADYRIAFVSGKPLNFKKIPVYDKGLYLKHGANLNPFELAGGPDFSDSNRSNPTTRDGFDLVAWDRDFGHRFVITDFLRDLNIEIVSDDGDRVHPVCPLSHLHSDGGDATKTPTVAVDPDGNTDSFRSGKWWFKCRHSHGDEHSSLDMLAALDTDEYMGSERMSDLLCRPDYYMDAVDGEAEYPDFKDYATLPIDVSSYEETEEDKKEDDEEDFPTQEEIQEKLPRGLVVRGNIIQTIGKDDKPGVRICGAFDIIGMTSDEHLADDVGVVIAFRNRFGKIVEYTVKHSTLYSDSKLVVADLAGKGLYIASDENSSKEFVRLLKEISSEKQIVTVNRPGYHHGMHINPRDGSVVGKQNGKKYRLSETMLLDSEEKRGNIAGWRKLSDVVVSCGNDFLVVGLLSGYTGILVDMLKMPTNPIINFAGTTSRGKTTAQRLGAAVWANPVQGGLLVKFNTTDNGIEALAARCSGTLLALDEAGQSGMTAQQYQKAIFTLAEGRGKTRLKATGEARAVRTWSTIITISEETGFADRMIREGSKAAAGAVARVWEIDVGDARILSNDVVEELGMYTEHFGVAGPAYVRFLHENGYLDNPEKIRAMMADILTRICACETAPQKRRSGEIVALVITAGWLAQEAGLLSSEYDVYGKMQSLYRTSMGLSARHLDPISDGIESLRENVLSNLGSSIVNASLDEEDRRRTADGFFLEGDNVKDHSQRVYCFSSKEILKHIGGNASAANVIRKLEQDGYTDGKRYTNIPGVGRKTHYRISGTLFHESD